LSYNEARRHLVELRQQRGLIPGRLVHYNKNPEDTLSVLGLGLDSEDLSPWVLVMDPEHQKLFAARPDQIQAIEVQGLPVMRKLQELTCLSRLGASVTPRGFDPRKLPIDENLSGVVVRHRKGGVYTVLCAMGDGNPDPVIVYIAHSDGTWWLRPWHEFGDGRFEAHGSTRLSAEEAGLDDIVHLDVANA